LKNTKVGTENYSLWVNLEAEVNFLAPIILSVGNLQPSVGKLQLVAPYFFSTHKMALTIATSILLLLLQRGRIF